MITLGKKWLPCESQMKNLGVLYPRKVNTGAMRYAVVEGCGSTFDPLGIFKVGQNLYARAFSFFASVRTAE